MFILLFICNSVREVKVKYHSYLSKRKRKSFLSIAVKRAVFLTFTGSTVFAPISVDLVLKANLQVDLIFLPK